MLDALLCKGWWVRSSGVVRRFVDGDLGGLTLLRFFFSFLLSYWFLRGLEMDF